MRRKNLGDANNVHLCGPYGTWRGSQFLTFKHQRVKQPQASSKLLQRQGAGKGVKQWVQQVPDRGEKNNGQYSQRGGDIWQQTSYNNVLYGVAQRGQRYQGCVKQGGQVSHLNRGSQQRTLTKLRGKGVSLHKQNREVRGGQPQGDLKEQPGQLSGQCDLRKRQLQHNRGPRNQQRRLCQGLLRDAFFTRGSNICTQTGKQYIFLWSVQLQSRHQCITMQNKLCNGAKRRLQKGSHALLSRRQGCLGICGYNCSSFLSQWLFFWVSFCTFLFIFAYLNRYGFALSLWCAGMSARTG